MKKVFKKGRTEETRLGACVRVSVRERECLPCLLSSSLIFQGNLFLMALLFFFIIIFLFLLLLFMNNFKIGFW